MNRETLTGTVTRLKPIITLRLSDGTEVLLRNLSKIKVGDTVTISATRITGAGVTPAVYYKARKV